MEGFSSIPNPVLFKVVSLLSTQEIARVARVSKDFYQACSECILRLYKSQGLGNISRLESIEAFGSIYTKKARVVKNWNSDKEVLEFKNVHGVASIKFGNNFTSILKHDGEVLSSLASQKNQLRTLEFTGVRQIDCKLDSMVLLTDPKVFLLKEEGTVAEWSTQEKVTCICVCNSGFVGTQEGNVYCWDQNTTHQIVFPEGNSSPIISLRASSKFLLILTADNNLYQSDLVRFTASKVFQSEKIALVALGFTHSLALAREDLPPLNSWETDQLSSWLASKGFEDCVPMVKNHQITGEEVEEGGDEYLVETLGISEVDRRQKLTQELERVKECSYSGEQQLYGWGRNNNMQLGIGNMHHKQPHKIPTPELLPEEFIKSVHADKCHSFILTSFGRVFVMGGQEYRKVDKREKKNWVNWREITRSLTENTEFSIGDLEVGADKVGLIVRKCVPRTSGEKGKMKAGDKVLHDILWNPRFQSEDFIVGYMDRFLGILELSATEFNSTDIPRHRIKYFKKNGQIVWDRRTRLDLM